MESSSELSPELKTAAKWIKDADAILICAGAGMSISPGTNVYGSEEDFAKLYPGMLSWGYSTSYQCMGLFHDPHVPSTVKWGYQAQHINNMRFKYPPHKGYTDLLGLISGKDYFVVTSNVDGCFERSGFDKHRIYTPQGDFMYLQCLKACSRDVYQAKPILDSILPQIQNCALSDPALIPTCSKCGSPLFPNVRGGDWFIHDHYIPDQDRFVTWVTSVQSTTKRLAVLEIGAGWNTPIVTRWPMEAIVRETKGAVLVRINPTHPSCPSDISAVGLVCGTEVLPTLGEIGKNVQKGELEEAEEIVEEKRKKKAVVVDKKEETQHPLVNWRGVMKQLRN